VIKIEDKRFLISLKNACIGFDITLSLDDFLLVKDYIEVEK